MSINFDRGYKIVRKTPEGYLPFIITITPFVYKLGITQKRINGFGPFAVFRTKKIAQRYMECMWSYQMLTTPPILLETDFVPSKEKWVWMVGGPTCAGEHYCHIDNMPPDTVLVEEFTPIREV